MKIIEYRIFMPLSVEENLIGHIWHASHEQSNDVKIEFKSHFKIPYDNSGNICIQNLPEYESDETEIKNQNKENKNSLNKSIFVSSSNLTEDIADYGLYTRKVRSIASNLPWFLLKLIPKDAMNAHEKTWDMYPYSKQVTFNDFLKKSGRIEIDSITRAYKYGENAEENVHNLSNDLLKKREVIIIDITESDNLEEEDATKFKSVKTGRGPLTTTFWTKDNNVPLICCYKLVTLDFKVFPIQSKIENHIMHTMKNMFTKINRKIFCNIDNWYDYSLEEIRKVQIASVAKKSDTEETSSTSSGNSGNL